MEAWMQTQPTAELIILERAVCTSTRNPGMTQRRGAKIETWNEKRLYIIRNERHATKAINNLALTTPTTAGLIPTKRQSRDLINHSLTLPHATRDTAVARRDIQRRIPREEVPWPEQQSHRLSWHDGEVLRRREVRDTKRVPEDDVCVVDICGRVGCDPCW